VTSFRSQVRPVLYPQPAQNPNIAPVMRTADTCLPQSAGPEFVMHVAADGLAFVLLCQAVHPAMEVIMPRISMICISLMAALAFSANAAGGGSVTFNTTIH